MNRKYYKLLKITLKNRNKASSNAKTIVNMQCQSTMLWFILAIQELQPLRPSAKKYTCSMLTQKYVV
jgi:hypothetical protein